MKEPASPSGLPAMAGVLFLVAWGLVDFHHIRHILHSDRQEAAVLVTTFAGIFVLLIAARWYAKRSLAEGN